MALQSSLRNNFCYNSLSRPSRIRVFHLLPDEDNSIIRGSLTEIDIGNTNVRYAAISYVWGSPTETSIIICDGQNLSIPASLEVVLRRLRRTSGRKVLSLWADSICINQATDSEALNERSHQVRKMGQIFSSAERTYIDLGDIPLVTYRHLTDLYEAIGELSWTDEYPNKLRVKFSTTENLILAGHPGWCSLADFMSHPWFTRMWVLQEFAMAKRVVLLLGADIESDALFLEQTTKCGCYFLYNGDLNNSPTLSQYRFPIIYKYMNIALLHKLRVMAQSNTGVTLEQFNDVLILRENFAATDCRDFVYSLLGMVPPTSTRLLAVNYNEHRHELGRRLYLHFLAHGYGILGLYQSVGIESLSVSWSIQLDSKTRDIIFNVLSDGTSEKANAYGDRKAQISACDKPPSLITKVFLLDKISLVFGKSIPVVRSSPVLTEPEPWLRELLKWLIGHGFDPLDRDSHGLSRTLCCGRYTPESDSDLPSVILPFIYAGKRLADYDPSGSDLFRIRDALLKPIWGHVCTVLDSIKARKFAVSTSGRFCFVPDLSQAGDQLVIISGAPQPFVLRPTTSEGQTFFRIVGACYVDGMMQGEVLDPQAGFEEVSIEIR